MISVLPVLLHTIVAVAHPCAPASTGKGRVPPMAGTSRLSAAEIFDRTTTAGKEELGRPVHNLAFSAMASGLAMGLSGLGVALLLTLLGKDGAGETVAYLAYPVGFIAVILGRQQLFTENTLFPVAATLSQASLLGRTARLWVVVLGANLVGTTLFALLVTRTPALPPEAAAELATLGADQAGRPFWTTFWMAVVAGWLIALVAWLVTASTDTVGQVLLIFLLTYLVGIGKFPHSIASSAEVLTAFFSGDLGLGSSLIWHSAAVLGNVVGGVVVVALFNYGQVHRSNDS